jgi:hypothetical protein
LIRGGSSIMKARDDVMQMPGRAKALECHARGAWFETTRIHSRRSAPTRRVQRCLVSHGSALLALFLFSVVPVRGQIATDTAGLGGRYGTLQMLLEKTFLQVDVLELEIRVDPETAAQVEDGMAVNGENADEEAILSALIAAPRVWARLTFKRDIGVDRLIREIRNSMRKAVQAGLLDPAGYDTISASLPEWYASLRERGVRNGDGQYYRIRGDTLRTTFVGRDGEQFIDETATSPVNRRALLTSWFAPGSDFRDKLLASLPRPSR